MSATDDPAPDSIAVPLPTNTDPLDLTDDDVETLLEAVRRAYLTRNDGFA